MKAKVRSRLGAIRSLGLGYGQQSFKPVCESLFITVRECNPARTDRVFKTATLRTYDNTSTGDPFERYDSKGLVKERGDYHDLMVIEQFGELPASFDSRKGHLGLNLELFHDRSK